jgi:hypothetical protein
VPPGYDEPALAVASYRAERELELALLTDPALHDRLDALGIELVTFGALAASAMWRRLWPWGSGCSTTNWPGCTIR